MCCGDDFIYGNAYRGNACIFSQAGGYASTCDPHIAPGTWDVGNNRVFSQASQPF